MRRGSERRNAKSLFIRFWRDGDRASATLASLWRMRSCHPSVFCTSPTTAAAICSGAVRGFHLRSSITIFPSSLASTNVLSSPHAGSLTPFFAAEWRVNTGVS